MARVPPDPTGGGGGGVPDDGSVTTAKIVNGAVTIDKIAQSAIDAMAAIPEIDVQVFNTSGLHAWNAPERASGDPMVLLVGGGGGGGKGSLGPSGSGRAGGAGGGAGGILLTTVPLHLMLEAAWVEVVRGGGGLGATLMGTSGTVLDTGRDGGVGGDTRLILHGQGVELVAGGGGGGQGGTTSDNISFSGIVGNTIGTVAGHAGSGGGGAYFWHRKGPASGLENFTPGKSGRDFSGTRNGGMPVGMMRAWLENSAPELMAPAFNEVNRGDLGLIPLGGRGCAPIASGAAMSGLFAGGAGGGSVSTGNALRSAGSVTGDWIGPAGLAFRGGSGGAASSGSSLSGTSGQNASGVGSGGGGGGAGTSGGSGTSGNGGNGSAGIAIIYTPVIA